MSWLNEESRVENCLLELSQALEDDGIHAGQQVGKLAMQGNTQGAHHLVERIGCLSEMKQKVDALFAEWDKLMAGGESLAVVPSLPTMREMLEASPVAEQEVETPAEESFRGEGIPAGTPIETNAVPVRERVEGEAVGVTKIPQDKLVRSMLRVLSAQHDMRASASKIARELELSEPDVARVVARMGSSYSRARQKMQTDGLVTGSGSCLVLTSKGLNLVREHTKSITE